jgi:hypothetical protein
MSSLADLSEIVGFFSYSREDDEASDGSLSALRVAIQRELSNQLGRSRTTFRLWQDQEAIAPGRLWESDIKAAVEQAVFFIPIVTPRAVNSHYCKVEFEAFLARENALGRTDLVFPLLYIRVPALESEAEWRKDPLLSIIGSRQYVDWRRFRQADVRTPSVREAIERFCEKIVEALREPWVSPEERRKQQEVDPQQRPEEEKRRAEAAPLTEEEKPPAEAAGRVEQETRRVSTARKADADLPDLAVFRDAPFAPELVVLPVGEFMMGSTEEEEEGFKWERPRHRVTIGQRFAIGRYPTTFAEYDRFCDATQREKPGDRAWGRGRRPVISVSWQDAQAYIAWLSQETGLTYRLPSEAEWEYACRAGTTSRYSFGDAITPRNANYAHSGPTGPARSEPTPRISGAGTTCTAMSRSGSRMTGTTITGARRWTDRLGRTRAQLGIRVLWCLNHYSILFFGADTRAQLGIRALWCCAAAPGTTLRRTADPQP